MIKKMWVKFDGMDIECFCSEPDKKCDSKKRKGCKEHIVKFIEVERNSIQEGAKKIAKAAEKSRKSMEKIVSEMEKSIKKFKV